MKTQLNLLMSCVLLTTSGTVAAAVRYVDANSTSPMPPYTNWATAARVIQDAVDAAALGDEILVTNGIYATGGRTVGTSLVVNRVAVDKPLTLRSVNGPAVTFIQGYKVSGTTHGCGDGAVRCVYLADAATLSGFTLTNGATRASDVWESTHGGGVRCTSTNILVTNCVLTGNSAFDSGGGVSGGTLNHCVLSGNSAGNRGGGAYGSTLNNCTLTDNSACFGAGANLGLLNNCVLTDNSASFGGGGASESTLNNCIVAHNTAAELGGGTWNVGYDFYTLNNCIIYSNTAPREANYVSSDRLNYCCTTPLPPEGRGNISLAPQLASVSHLSTGSPCRGAGSAAYASGTDIDGEPWANPPSIGCDEYCPGAVTGALGVGLAASYTNAAVGFPVNLTALIEGRTSASEWDFGDGIVVSNRPFATHAWAAAGNYEVLLRAYNESYPEGLSGSLMIRIAEEVHYVAADGRNPQPPYTSWATAATAIQDAVDAAGFPGALVLVTNGTYADGGRTISGIGTSRVVVDRPITVRSINGPKFTFIEGRRDENKAMRCVYLTNGASLSGFTLTNGAAENGGGVLGESVLAVVTNCTLAGNLAFGWGGGSAKATLSNSALIGNSARSGGGAWNGSLNSCVLTGNSASQGGGGAYGELMFIALNNCTLTGNSAGYGGGVANGDFGHASLNNCIVYFNSARDGTDNYAGGIFNYSCTTPLPASGSGNLSLDPQLASATFLSVGSPCRGTGSAAYTTGSDIDGEPWGNPPSIGCDEYHAGAGAGPLSLSIVAGLTNVSVGFPVQVTALIEGRAAASSWNFGDSLVLSNRPFATHSWVTPGNYIVTARAYNESNPGGVSATATVHVFAQPVHYVAAGNTNPLPPYTSWATAAAKIQDAVDAVTLPGALVLVTNGIYATGGRAVGDYDTTNRVAVDKPLEVRSVNGPEFTIIEGWRATTNFYEAVRCVYLANGATLSGFTLRKGGAWTGGGVRCQSETAAVSNCFIIDNAADQEGGGAMHGRLDRCTISSNTAKDSGGGVAYGILNHCTLTGNSALGDSSYYSRGYGGGAAYATLNNCKVTGNSARLGGGTCGCTLNACTLVGNAAIGKPGWYGSAGGAYGGTLNNCIVYFNTAENGLNYTQESPWSLNYCCTTPLPTAGVGNLTNAPLFVDLTGGNLRLQSLSPCINAGNNAYAADSTDLDDNPRIVRGTVDIGAYEFQGLGSAISYAWLQQYGLPTDGSVDFVDSDADGHNNWQEWRCGTDPNNTLSALRLLSASSDGTNVTVHWQSAAGVTYFLERSTNLLASPPFRVLATNLSGQTGTTAYLDTNAMIIGPQLYRVGVGQ